MALVEVELVFPGKYSGKKTFEKGVPQFVGEEEAKFLLAKTRGGKHQFIRTKEKKKVNRLIQKEKDNRHKFDPSADVPGEMTEDEVKKHAREYLEEQIMFTEDLKKFDFDSFMALYNDRLSAAQLKGLYNYHKQQTAKKEKQDAELAAKEADATVEVDAVDPEDDQEGGEPEADEPTIPVE